jgi:RNA polymerase sigma factor (sigma-70 family)
MAGKKDQILIEGIKTQDPKVITELYKLFFPSVKQFIYRNNGNEENAKDVFNDAIVVMLEKARQPDFRLSCSLKTYIYAVCRNLWLKKLKSGDEAMISYELIEDTLQGADLLEEEAFNINYARLLYQKHLVRMNSNCRELIGLFLEGKSFKEITAELNYENESYARKRKYRCLKLLMKRIKSDPDYNKIYEDDQH